MLSKGEILAAKDIVTELVSVPEWGGDVYVKTMSSQDRDRYESDWYRYRKNRMGDVEDTKHFRAFLVTRTACDADGSLVFCDADVEAVAGKSAAAVARIADAAIRLNGLFGTTREDDAKN
jgi:hypothetical protein